MEYFLIVLAVWPVAGLLILPVLVRRRGGGALPPATRGAEVLARMYLWPLMWWRLDRPPAARKPKPPRGC